MNDNARVVMVLVIGSLFGFGVGWAGASAYLTARVRALTRRFPFYCARCGEEIPERPLAKERPDPPMKMNFLRPERDAINERRCTRGITPPGYAPCIREAEHDGPCAHPFAEEE